MADSTYSPFDIDNFDDFELLTYGDMVMTDDMTYDVDDLLAISILQPNSEVTACRKPANTSELVGLTKNTRASAVKRRRNKRNCVTKTSQNRTVSRGRPKKDTLKNDVFSELEIVKESNPHSTFTRRKPFQRRITNPVSKTKSTSGKRLPWTLAALAIHMKSNEAALEFCQEKALLPKTKLCPVCREKMIYSEKLSSDKGLGYVFRCSRRACQIVRSARTGTWFERSKLPICKSLLLTYCFASNFPFKLAIHESSFTAGCTSPTTVSDWYSYCREVCVHAMTCQMLERVGGVGHIIEMDEANVGGTQTAPKAFDGQWVLGFYCRATSKVSLVCMPNNKHDASTLIPIIEEHVNPGSTIIVECWDPAVMLGVGYQHLVRNCHIKFVNPSYGLQISGLDKIWKQLKCSVAQADNYRKAYQLNEYLCEFLWRRWVDVSVVDPFEAFLRDAAILYTLPNDDEIEEE